MNGNIQRAKSKAQGAERGIASASCYLLSAMCHVPILLLLILPACGITIRPYKPASVEGLSIKVTVKNHTHEPGMTYAFKYAVEERFIRSGAAIVESGETYEIEITLKETEVNPVGFTKYDIARSYNLRIKGNYRVLEKKESGDVTVLNSAFSPVYGYAVNNIVEGEINRKAAVDKTAEEISKIMFDNFTTSLSIKP